MDSNALPRAKSPHCAQATCDSQLEALRFVKTVDRELEEFILEWTTLTREEIAIDEE